MNKVFKVIGNKNALESKKVVSELASANVASSDERSCRSDYSIINLADNFKLSLGHMLSIVTLFIITPHLANADIIADTNAPTNQQATILNTASGATQVNIQTPTNAGISVNQYSEFNTKQNGTILNNSRVNVQTQSAGWVEGNPWLAGGEAKAIVNQVNSSDPSSLTGTIEVAGKRADVIIANPSGISVDGASILNASGTTLTTGKVNMSGGAIQSYSIENGKITIEGNGLNDSGSDYTRILSRATEINANIHANNLKVIAGANEISADTTTITKKTPTSPAPSVAIDTKALGGMYAGSITLVGTESGVGVNNAGVVNANNFTLSSDGKLTNSGTIAVNKKSNIAVKTLENSHAITSNENIEITADTLNNSGKISALRELKSTTDTLTNSGTMQAARLDLTSDTLTNSTGTIAQAGSNSLEINAHKLTNTNGALLGSHEEEPLVAGEGDTTTTESGATVTTDTVDASSGTTSSTSDPLTAGSITVANELRNDGGEISGASVALGVSGTLSNTSDSLINVANLEHTGSLLDNQNSKIMASGISALSLVSFTNLGSTIEGGNLQFNTTSSFDNTGGSILGDLVDIEADSIVNQSGVIQSQDTLALTGGSLDNTEGTLHSLQNILFNLTGDITNANGSISAATTLDAKAHDISNDAGVMQADQFVNIEAASLHNAGDILSGGDMSVTLENESTNEGTLSAASNLFIEATAEFANSAIMSAVGSLSFTGNMLSNNANGEITAENIDIQADTLTNRGAINSDALTWLKTGALNNIGTGAIYGDTIIIDTDTLLNTNETVDGITKSAVIAARELLNIGAQNITNSEGAELLSLGVLNIGGLIDEWGNVEGYAQVLDNLSAHIESEGDMYLGANEVNNVNTHLETEEVADPTVTEVFIQRLWGDYDWYPLSECYGITQGFEDNYCGINDKIARFQELGGVVLTNRVTYPGSSPFGPSPTLTPEEQAEVKSLASQIRAANFEDFYQKIIKSTTTHTELISSDPATISVGGNLLVDGKLYNKDSHVIAAGTIQTTQGLTNEATKGENVTSYDGSTIERRTVEGGSHDFVWHGEAPYTIAPIINEVYDLATTLYEMNTATQSVDNPGEYDASTVFLNDTEIRSISPNLALPTSSLFSINVDDPNALMPYITTDPRFTNYSEWLSSDYMISALGLDPTNIMKRLGDGYYELRLIKDQIAQLTGKRFLDGYGSDQEQYKALMDAGVTYASAYGLRPGVALSSEQIAQLTSDMVWLVEEQVTLADGSSVTALVPKVYVVAKEGDLDGSGSLLSANNIVVSGTDELINSGTIYGRDIVSLSSQSSISNLSGKIQANTLALYASADINNIGGTLEAQTGMLLDAGDDINIASETYETSTAEGQSNFSRTGIKNVASIYVDDPNGVLLMNAGKDVNLAAANIQNQGTLTQISAGNDVNVASVTVAEQNNAVWDSQNHYKKGYTNEVGSSIQTAGDITVVADNDVNVKASTIESESGTVGIGAKNDINIESGINTTNSDEAYYYKRKTLGGSKKTTMLDKVDMTMAASSYVGGNQVILDSGHDVVIKGSDIISDSGTSINAINDIHIIAETENVNQMHFREVKKSGIMGTGGIGFTIGSAQNSNDNQDIATYNRGSMVGSLGGDTTITAGESYKQVASSVLSGNSDREDSFIASGDVNIEAKKVDIEAGYDTYSGGSITKSKSSGLTIALSGSIANAVSATQNTISSSQDIGQSKHSRVNAMAAANTAWSAYKAVDAAQEAISAPTNIGVSITVGSSKSKSETNYEGVQAISSKIAGKNVKVTATGDGKNSDVNIIGSDVAGSQSTYVEADNDVNILAAASTSEQHSTNKSSGWNFGVVIGTGGVGITLGGHVGKGHSDGVSTTYTNSHVGSLSGETTIKAGDTTNIIGGQVLGESVTLDTTNLNIESLQDTATYDSKQKNAGGQLTVGAGFSVSGSFSKSNIDANYASVNEQSGILAGDGGYNINVTKDTSLKGGIITSTQNAEDNDFNSFSTGTLVASNINNFSRYEGDALGVSATASYSFQSNTTPTDNKGSTTPTPVAGTHEGELGVGKSIGYGEDSDSQSSTTYAGINTANITITGNSNTDTPSVEATAAQLDGNGMKTITVANLTDIFTSTSTDQVETNSGSLKNTFDAEAVQHELDVQTRVTQTFDTNRQEVKAEINSVIDNARDIVNNPNATPKQIAEANQKIEDMQHLGVLVDSISGALYSPADNALGTVANTLSPAIVYEIGQHFKAEGTEGSAQHILAQTLVAAVTAHLAGNDELTAGLSAGGAEIIAPKLAEWLYGVDDASELTSEQKNTISAVISLGSAAVGSTTGQTTDAVSSSVAGTVAMEDNWLSPEQLEEKEKEWQLADTWYEKQWVDISWMPADAKGDYVRLGGHLVNIYDGTIGAMPQMYDGLSDTLPKMWENSPTEAKAVLVTAGGIAVLPFAYLAIDSGITYVYMNPSAVIYGEYSAAVANDLLNESMPPTTPIGQSYFIYDHLINNNNFFDESNNNE